MNGIVVYYYPDVQTGLIKAEDGREYVFTKAAWASEIEPKEGQMVIFAVDVDVIVTNITVVKLDQRYMTEEPPPVGSRGVLELRIREESPIVLFCQKSASCLS